VIVYSIIYWQINMLEYLGEQAQTLGLVGQPVPIFACLYFSFLAFNSVIFGGILPKLGTFPQLIAGSEAFIGVFLISLFVLAMGRKIGGR